MTNRIDNSKNPPWADEGNLSTRLNPSLHYFSYFVFLYPFPVIVLSFTYLVTLSLVSLGLVHNFWLPPPPPPPLISSQFFEACFIVKSPNTARKRPKMRTSFKEGLGKSLDASLFVEGPNSFHKSLDSDLNFWTIQTFAEANWMNASYMEGV